MGCLLFSAGLLLTTFSLSQNPSYAPLALSLALTGIGIGTTVVPITSSALSAVPPERSGMAASATNTSREIGAVTGVAILGALVNSQLHLQPHRPAQAPGHPGQLPAIVINALETGYVPSSGHSKGAGGAEGAGHASLIQQVIAAAYGAFYSGLRAALFLSAILVFLAGVITLVLPNGRERAREVPRADPAGQVTGQSASP